MKEAKREQLESKGWSLGTADEFLGLSPQESAILDMKHALGNRLRDIRSTLGLTQTRVAEKLGSSQSRVAKMEAGEPTVSLDLLVKALLALGASTQDVATAISTPGQAIGTPL